MYSKYERKSRTIAINLLDFLVDPSAARVESDDHLKLRLVNGVQMETVTKKTEHLEDEDLKLLQKIKMPK